jgi:hypothetical protein
MGQIFGKEKPLKEVMRENKRMITRAVRELDREKMALEREEKRLTMEIKKAAKEQQMSSVKIMAKVRICDVCIDSYIMMEYGSVSTQMKNYMFTHTVFFFTTYYSHYTTTITIVSTTQSAIP